MNERRETRKRWVQPGQYAVEVEVEMIYPADRPRNRAWSQKPYAGSTKLRVTPRRVTLNSLRAAGRVFQAVSQ